MKKIFCLVIIVLFVISCTESSTDPLPQNNPPKINSLSAQTDSISGLTQIQLVAYAEDPDGDELEYLWESRQGRFEGSGSIVNWISPNILGLKLITCTVSDGKGGEDKDSLQISITGYNNQPLFISELKLLTEGDINIGERVQLEASTNSNPSSDLAYRWRILDIGGVKNVTSTKTNYEFEPEINGIFKCIYFVENSKNEFAYKTLDIPVGEDADNTNNNPVISKFELSQTDFFVNDSIIVNVEYEDPDSDKTEIYLFFVGEITSYSIGNLSDNRYYFKLNRLPASKTQSHIVVVGVAKDSKNGKGYAFQVVTLNKN